MSLCFISYLRKKRKIDEQGTAERSGDEVEIETQTVRYDFTKVKENTASVEEYEDHKKQFIERINELEEESTKLAPNMKGIYFLLVCARVKVWTSL